MFFSSYRSTGQSALFLSPHTTWPKFDPNLQRAPYHANCRHPWPADAKPWISDWAMSWQCICLLFREVEFENANGNLQFIHEYVAIKTLGISNYEHNPWLLSLEGEIFLLFLPNERDLLGWRRWWVRNVFIGIDEIKRWGNSSRKARLFLASELCSFCWMKLISIYNSRTGIC